MAEHYGVINKISRLGRPALTEAAEQALVEQYADELEAGALVLGGHQFLTDYPGFGPYSLGVLFANLSVGRLGPGTYAGVVTVDGQPVIILNGFHPRQLSFFTADDTVCAFLHGSSDTAWDSLRNDLIGTTDPAKADAGSIRGPCSPIPTGSDWRPCRSNFNGVHMSAGPLEGLVELARFFGGSVGGLLLHRRADGGRRVCRRGRRAGRQPHAGGRRRARVCLRPDRGRRRRTGGRRCWREPPRRTEAAAVPASN